VKWVSGGMQRRGLIRELLCVPGAMGDLWPHPHMTGSGKKGNKKEQRWGYFDQDKWTRMVSRNEV
jgi:hypothetical protein